MGKKASSRRCFNGSSVRERRLWRPSAKTKTTLAGFNGSSVRERRLWRSASSNVPPSASFNGSSVRERRLWLAGTDTFTLRAGDSMGPASENAGYGHSQTLRLRSPAGFNGSSVRERRLWAMTTATQAAASWLQWVQRPRTPVMAVMTATQAATNWLQWVQRPRTPVMKKNSASRFRSGALQWVQRPRTPVMRAGGLSHSVQTSFNGSSVRERRLCADQFIKHERSGLLQWVQRPRTPVMIARKSRRGRAVPASMGPASENAGYGNRRRTRRQASIGFNGSSVRERRLWRPSKR